MSLKRPRAQVCVMYAFCAVVATAVMYETGWAGLVVLEAVLAGMCLIGVWVNAAEKDGRL